MPLTVVVSAAIETPTSMNTTQRARQISNSFLMANISSKILAAGPQVINRVPLAGVSFSRCRQEASRQQVEPRCARNISQAEGGSCNVGVSAELAPLGRVTAPAHT